MRHLDSGSEPARNAEQQLDLAVAYLASVCDSTRNRGGSESVATDSDQDVASRDTMSA
jgi:hypothetical protein